MYWPSPHQANVHCVQIIFLLYAKCIPTYIIRLQIISSRHNRICINVGSIQNTFLSLFVWDPSPIIAMPCPSVPESLLVVRLDWCAPGVWRSRPVLALIDRILPNQLLEFCQDLKAEVLSRLWSCCQLWMLKPAVDSFNSWKPAVDNIDNCSKLSTVLTALSSKLSTAILLGSTYPLRGGLWWWWEGS